MGWAREPRQGLCSSTRDTHSRARHRRKSQRAQAPPKPCSRGTHSCPDYILFVREMTLAHCSGAKQTPPTISWAWALRADARRNLKEAGYFGC